MLVELNLEELQCLCEVLDGTLDPISGGHDDFLNALYSKLKDSMSHSSNG